MQSRFGLYLYSTSKTKLLRVYCCYYYPSPQMCPASTRVILIKPTLKCQFNQLNKAIIAQMAQAKQHFNNQHHSASVVLMFH